MSIRVPACYRNTTCEAFPALELCMIAFCGALAEIELAILYSIEIRGIHNLHGVEITKIQEECRTCSRIHPGEIIWGREVQEHQWAAQFSQGKNLGRSDQCFPGSTNKIWAGLLLNLNVTDRRSFGPNNCTRSGYPSGFGNSTSKEDLMEQDDLGKGPCIGKEWIREPNLLLISVALSFLSRECGGQWVSPLSRTIPFYMGIIRFVHDHLCEFTMKFIFQRLMHCSGLEIYKNKILLVLFEIFNSSWHADT